MTIKDSTSSAAGPALLGTGQMPIEGGIALQKERLDAYEKRSFSMNYRLLALAIAALSSAHITAAAAQSVYVAPGAVYIGGGPVYVNPAPSNGYGNAYYSNGYGYGNAYYGNGYGYGYGNAYY